MVNGNEASDLYKYLRLNSNLNGGEITWNFAKFLVNRDGSLIQYFGPKTCPLDVVPFFTPFL
jgi:glutathione peroxidase